MPPPAQSSPQVQLRPESQQLQPQLQAQPQAQPQPQPQPASTSLFAKVVFAFAGTGPNEMPLNAGDTVEVIKRGPPGGWCKGKTGAFPTDYVQFIGTAVAKPAPAASPAVSASMSGVAGMSSIPISTTPVSATPMPTTNVASSLAPSGGR